MTISRDVLEIELAMQTILDTILDHHARVLTQAWTEAWASVADDLTATLTVLASDGVISGEDLAVSARAAQGLARARVALDELVILAGDVISEDAYRAIGLGIDGELAMIQAQVPPQYRGIARVDDTQIRVMLDRTTQQITAVTYPISADTDLAIRRELARGMITGDNPRTVADRMVTRIGTPFTGGLTRALNISRTEILDAMRTAQHETDRANAGILAGWTWGAHLDSRTCISCISMHGTEWPLTEPGPIDHHSGRCARLPRTKSWAELGFPGIPEPDLGMVDAGAWFDGLTEQEQRSMLGARGFDAWQAGTFPMDQWSARKSNDGWRDSYVPAKPPKETT